MSNKEPKKSWYATWWGILIMIFLFINIFPYLSKLTQFQNQNEKIALETTENNDVYQSNDSTYTPQVIDGFSIFSSDTFGFSVLVPSQPKENIVDISDMTIHNFQAERVVNEMNPMIYSVNFAVNNNGKILSDDSISAFLDNYLSGRLSIATNAKIIEEKDAIFKGFRAKEYKYLDTLGSIEIEHRGIIFIIDGDSIDISVAFPSSLKEELVKYDEFKKSFNLMAINLLSEEKYLIDGTIKFKVPQDWKKSDSKSKGGIVDYASEAGHSIALREQAFSCNEIAKQMGLNNIDRNGYIYYTYPLEQYNINMKTITKCIENNEKIYTLSGTAPEKTFFRSEAIFKKALSSFDF